MGIFKTFWEGLGKTPQARVKALILIIAAVTGMIILTLNLRFGYNTPFNQAPCKCKGWWVEWDPAADIHIDVKKVSASGGQP